MKNKILGTTFIINILFCVIMSSGVVKAQSSKSVAFPLGLTVHTPFEENSYSNPVFCNITFTCGLGIQTSLNYSIDGKFQEGIFMRFGALASSKNTTMVGTFYLPELPDGPHQLSFGIEATLHNYSGVPPSDIPFKQTMSTEFLYPNYYASWINTINFTIDANGEKSPPQLIFLSPKENQTYDSPDIALDFVRQTYAYWIGYSLDGKENITLSSNTTLKGLSGGSHNLTLYIKEMPVSTTDFSNTINFTVRNLNVAEPTTLIAIITIITIVVVCTIVALAYYKNKRKSANNASLVR